MTEETTNDRTEYSALKARKKPVRKVVPILMEPDIGAQYQKVNEEYWLAKVRYDNQTDNKVLKAIYDEVVKRRDALYDEMQAATVEYVFRPIHRTVMDKLIADHPPTPKQAKEAQSRGTEIGWNPDTLPPVFVAESLETPALTLEEVQDMWDDPDWNTAELISLFEAAMEVNQTRIDPSVKKD